MNISEKGFGKGVGTKVNRGSPSNEISPSSNIIYSISILANMVQSFPKSNWGKRERKKRVKASRKICRQLFRPRFAKAEQKKRQKWMKVVTLCVLKLIQLAEENGLNRFLIRSIFQSLHLSKLGWKCEFWGEQLAASRPRPIGSLRHAAPGAKRPRTDRSGNGSEKCRKKRRFSNKTHDPWTSGWRKQRKLLCSIRKITSTLRKNRRTSVMC